MTLLRTVCFCSVISAAHLAFAIKLKTIKDASGTSSRESPLSCSLPNMNGRPDCECPVESYYACQSKYFGCKDKFGICDPAFTGAGRMVEYFTKWWDEPAITCPTIVNNFTGFPRLDCQQSFVADFVYDGKPCVCYESAIDAPMRWDDEKYTWVSYDQSLLDGQKSGFPYLYKTSKLEAVSCAERGIRYDKKVHPCARHMYTVFMSPQCQVAYRENRAKKIKANTEAPSEFQKVLGAVQAVLRPELANLTITQSMYAGTCRFGA